MDEVIRTSGALPESVLRAIHIVVDELSFIRKGFDRGRDANTDFTIGYGVEKIEDGEYRTTLVANAVRAEVFEAKVQISGYWEINENDPNKTHLLEENALAILFPYVRSEMTLLTAQPETEPIVWPPMNINKIMMSAKPAKDRPEG